MNQKNGPYSFTVVILTESLVPTSVTRWPAYLFNVRPFTSIKICPRTKKLAK